MNVKEEELIEYVKPILKAQGFKKKAKRWTKVTDHFTYIFFIQGSSYDKEDYYVRPGIIINNIELDPFMYYVLTIGAIREVVQLISSGQSFWKRWSGNISKKSSGT